MNEQDLFDIMDGLTERQIAEASEWKYRRGKVQDNEIDSILTVGTMPEKITYNQTAPETEAAAAEPVRVSTPAGNERPSRVIRSATAGLAAVAAIFALVFGGIAFKLYRDNKELTASQPGAAVSEGEIAVTEINAESGSTYTVTETDWDVINSMPEYGTTVTFAPEETPAEYIEDNTVSAGETNFLGGKGPVKPVVEGNQYMSVFQDDDYYYFSSGYRALKSTLNGNEIPEEELLCQKAGCAHQSDDCVSYRYGSGHLLCSTEDVFYIDWTTESLQEGVAGGLKRIFSDGTTEDMHPQKQIVDYDKEIDDATGSMYYTNVLRLGDSGIYFVAGFYFRYDEPVGNATLFPPILLNTRTGERITLRSDIILGSALGTSYHAEYDEASGHLFMSHSGTDMRVREIDIYTGALVQEYDSTELESGMLSWFVRDHVLHFLGEAPNNGFHVNWYAHDMSTGETKIVRGDCRLNSFAYRNGRVYAAYHASVGNDALLSYAPDGTDETLLAEISNSLDSILSFADPDQITVMSYTGAYFLYRPDSGFSRLI